MSFYLNILKRLFFYLFLPFLFIELSARLFFSVYTRYKGSFPLELSPFAWNINFVADFFKEKLVMFAEHDELGWFVRSNVDIVFQVSEYNSRIKTVEVINGIGGRDDGINKEVFALALGDGYTFCDGLEIKDCWTEILEDMLGKDVLNLGVSGYGTYQQYLLAKKVLQKMQFRLILWQITYVDYLKDDCFISRRNCNVFSPNLVFYKKPFLGDILGESFILGSIKSVFDIYETRKIYRNIRAPHIKYIEEIQNLCSTCQILIVETYKVADSLRRDLCRRFRCIRKPPNDEKYFFKDKHLNPQGNLYLAQQVFETIKELGL
ncbi:MAG: hypothetical protein N2254_02160 [bacterium]|nr:hypothetical protein [bacterium]